MCRLKDVFGSELSIYASFIVGLPGETDEEIQKTFEWMVSGKSPIDGWGYNALHIDPGGRAPFAVNPQRYGIRFSNPNDPSYWEHDTANAIEVVSRTHELTTKSSFQNRISGFPLFRLMNLGYKFEELRNMSVMEACSLQAEQLQRTVKMKNEYFSKLIGRDAAGFAS